MDPDDGYRAGEPEGERTAAFCRLEHVVPWAMHGAHWAAGRLVGAGEEPASCSHCGEPVGGRRVLLVRHRGAFRIPDAFCGVDHLLAWAKAGGRWR